MVKIVMQGYESCDLCGKKTFVKLQPAHQDPYGSVPEKDTQENMVRDQLKKDGWYYARDILPRWTVVALCPECAAEYRQVIKDFRHRKEAQCKIAGGLDNAD